LNTRFVGDDQIDQAIPNGRADIDRIGLNLK